MLSTGNIVTVVSLAVTLTVAHGLKLHMNNALTLANFNSEWMMASAGLLVGALVNDLVTPKLLDAILPNYTDDMVKTLVTDIVNTVVLLVVQQVVVSLASGSQVEFSPSFIRNVFLVVAGILVYDILIQPLVPDNMKEGNSIVGSVNGILKKTAAIAASDYMSDLDFDNFPVEVGTTAAGIVIGELTETPLADMLAPAPVDAPAAE